MSNALIVASGIAALSIIARNFAYSMDYNCFLALPWRFGIAMFKVIFSMIFLPIILFGMLGVFSSDIEKRRKGFRFAIIGIIVEYFLVNDYDVWRARGLVGQVEDDPRIVEAAM